MQVRNLKHLLAASAFAIVVAVGCASKPSDEQLATNLKAQMFSDPQTKSADLQVAVKNGVVTLSGTAPSDAARYEAYKLAASTPGVSKVNDQVAVQAPVQSAEATPRPTVPPLVKTPLPTKHKRAREIARRTHKKHAHHAASTDTTTEAKEAPSSATQPAPASTTATPAAAMPVTQPDQTSAAPPTQAPPPPPPPPPVRDLFPSGTTVEIQTSDPIDTKTGQAGDEFQASLAQPLTWDSRIVVPKGANVYLRLVAAQTSGQYKGQSELQLRLVRLELHGADYALNSSTYTEVGNSRGKDTAQKVGGGAVLGAIIGAIAGGGRGAVIGGAAGAGAGGIYQGGSKAKQVRIPAETRLDFKLEQPLSIPLPLAGGSPQ